MPQPPGTLAAIWALPTHCLNSVQWERGGRTLAFPVLVHSCARPYATFKDPSNNSELGVGGLPTLFRVRRRLECQAASSAIPLCVSQMEQVGHFYSSGFQQKV
jgi:hypothetical protein